MFKIYILIRDLFSLHILTINKIIPASIALAETFNENNSADKPFKYKSCDSKFVQFKCGTCDAYYNTKSGRDNILHQFMKRKDLGVKNVIKTLQIMRL